MDADDIAAARRRLAALDPALKRADAQTPPYDWRRQAPGFEGLVRIMIGQQISTRAAAAIFDRCRTVLGSLAPDVVLAASHETLRACGLAGRKIGQVQNLAAEVVRGDLDLSALATLDDRSAILHLTARPGVGPWTAQIYLLFAEGRQDLCPEGDLALREALRMAEGGVEPISPQAFARRAEAWSPDRGHAAHLLWGYYAVRQSTRDSRG